MATLNKFPIRISVIGSPKPGSEVEVRILIAHPMETGFRIAENGIDKVPKNIIEKIRVKMDQQVLFEAQVGTGVAANPLLSFIVPVKDVSSVFSVEWEDDRGATGRAERELIPLKI